MFFNVICFHMICPPDSIRGSQGSPTLRYTRVRLRADALVASALQESVGGAKQQQQQHDMPIIIQSPRRELRILLTVQLNIKKTLIINFKNKQRAHQCVENVKRFHLIGQLSLYRQ